MTVRPAAASDRAGIARICLLTGDVGRDATGAFGDDTAISDVYATPYLEGPGGFALVWDVDGEARGYVLGTVDTVGFQTWFSEEWWPSVGVHRTEQTEKDKWLLAAARDPNRTLGPHVASYPAHLHIDLLPELQGKGVGRVLIEAAVSLLAQRGVPGVHLSADAANAGALAFYPRVGFETISRDAGGVVFGRRITGDFPWG